MSTAKAHSAMIGINKMAVRGMTAPGRLRRVVWIALMRAPLLWTGRIAKGGARCCGGIWLLAHHNDGFGLDVAGRVLEESPGHVRGIDGDFHGNLVVLFGREGAGGYRRVAAVGLRAGIPGSDGYCQRCL